MKNLNLLYNKTYYMSLGTSGFEEDLKKYNSELTNVKFNKEHDYKESLIANRVFELKVAYPGLLVGVGNPHGAHTSPEDINIGFTFDYVTGQPIIPGSSVKGVLRHYIEKKAQVLEHFFGIEINGELISELFEENDVFLDAVISKGNKDGYILGFDYITPHSDIIKNPVPIKFIKVIPDVQFEFRFKLTDGKLSANEKANLYKEVLMLFGAGAKTNVGYGILLDVN